VVLITGFESFNVDLYKKAAVVLARACPGLSLRVFSDRDLGTWGLGWGWVGLGGAVQAPKGTYRHRHECLE